MNLRPEQLGPHLQKKLAPLYVVHGDEPLLVIETADAIRAAARSQGFAEREVLMAGQGFKWDALFLAAGNLSLFGGDKLVDLRIPSGKPGRDGGEALKRYCGQLPAGIVTLVTLPELDWQTKKGGWFAALVTAGLAVECNAPPTRELPAWIAERLKRQNQEATQDALDFIAAHVEGNLLAAHQEIQKLGLIYPEGSLSLEQVEAAVLNVARYSIDTLREALAGSDTARCARILEGLRAEGAALPLVLWTISSEVRAIAQVRGAIDAGQSMDMALKSARVFGPRQGTVRAAAQRVSAATARSALLQAARIDRMIKGLVKGDVWDELLQLTLKLSLPGRAPSSRG